MNYNLFGKIFVVLVQLWSSLYFVSYDFLKHNFFCYWCCFWSCTARFALKKCFLQREFLFVGLGFFLSCTAGCREEQKFKSLNVFKNFCEIDQNYFVHFSRKAQSSFNILFYLLLLNSIALLSKAFVNITKYISDVTMSMRSYACISIGSATCILCCTDFILYVV